MVKIEGTLRSAILKIQEKSCSRFKIFLWCFDVSSMHTRKTVYLDKTAYSLKLCYVCLVTLPIVLIL